MLEVHFPDYNCQSFSLLTQPRRGWNVSHVYYASILSSITKTVQLLSESSLSESYLRPVPDSTFSFRKTSASVLTEHERVPTFQEYHKIPTFSTTCSTCPQSSAH